LFKEHIAMRSAIGIALLVLSTAAVAEAQEAADRYILLAAQRTGTMQQEINDAAARGFRVVAASRTEGVEVIVLLEQSPDKYTYRLISTTRTGTLQREISDAAANGYRVVPRAVTTKRAGGGFNATLGANSSTEGELLVLMEKGPEGPARAQYQVLATSRTGTLQKEISQAAINGYLLVALTSRGEHVAILERGER
jgi:hypothetical protein